MLILIARAFLILASNMTNWVLIITLYPARQSEFRLESNEKLYET